MENTDRYKMKLTYELTGAGFSRLIISIGDKEEIVESGYLEDTLGDMVRAAIFVHGGGYGADIHFNPEVGGLFLLVRMTGWDSVEVIQNDEIIFNEKGLRGSLPEAVLSMAQEVLDTYGLDGYNEKWIEHEFPKAEIDLLSSLIEKSKNKQTLFL